MTVKSCPIILAHSGNSHGKPIKDAVCGRVSALEAKAFSVDGDPHPAQPPETGQPLPA